MTDKLNIVSLLNNSVIDSSDQTKEFFSLMDKENEVNYFRRLYLVNFRDGDKTSGLTKNDFKQAVESFDFANFIAECSAHPAMSVEVSQYSINKVRATINLFIEFIDKGNLFTTIDVNSKSKRVDIHTFELELSVVDGRPYFTASICNPWFDGYKINQEDKSVSFIDNTDVQVIDYLEMELF